MNPRRIIPTTMTRLAVVEWILLVALVLAFILQLPAHNLENPTRQSERSLSHGDLRDGPRNSLPGKGAADAGSAITSALPANGMEIEGLRISPESLKQGWMFSFCYLYADGLAHSLGNGPGLPEDLAPELGLTLTELQSINDKVAAAVERMKTHERKIAKLENGVEGQSYVIPAYGDEHELIVAGLRKNVIATLGAKSISALELVSASPYLSAGEKEITVSALIENGTVGVALAQGRSTMSGSYDSKVGEFVTSRYGHLIDFQAIERQNKK